MTFAGVGKARVKLFSLQWALEEVISEIDEDTVKELSSEFTEIQTLLRSVDNTIERLKHNANSEEVPENWFRRRASVHLPPSISNNEEVEVAIDEEESEHSRHKAEEDQAPEKDLRIIVPEERPRSQYYAKGAVASPSSTWTQSSSQRRMPVWWKNYIVTPFSSIRDKSNSTYDPAAHHGSLAVLDRFARTRAMSVEKVEAQEQKKGFSFIVAEDSSARVHWDIIVIVLILSYCCLMPLRSAFGQTHSSKLLHIKGKWLYLELCADAIFMLDILVNFRTSYRLNDGTLITEPRAIALKYIKSWFFLDLIASFPLDFAFLFLHLSSYNQRSLKFIRIIRVLRYSKILRVIRLYNMNGRFLTSTLNPGILQLWRLSVLLAVAWHYIACSYWAISISEGFCKPDNWESLSFGDGFTACLSSWAPFVGYKHKSLQQQYSQALFFAVQVSTGIGRDIIPRTNAEIAFTVACITFGMFMYASILAAISSAVTVLNAHGIERSEKLGRIKTYLLRHGVKKQLQLEILNYYIYLTSTTAHKYESDEDLRDLPIILRIKLELALKQDTVGSVPLFQGLHAACILSLVHHINSGIALPSEILYSAGSMGDRMYIIEKGSVILTVPRKIDHFIRIRNQQKKKYEILNSNDKLNVHHAPKEEYRVPSSRSENKHSYLHWRRKLAEFQESIDSTQTVTVEKLNKRSDYFGESALIQRTHITYATSEVLSELHLLKYNEIKSTLSEFPSFSLRLREVVATRIARCFEVLESTSSLSNPKPTSSRPIGGLSFFADTEQKQVAACIIQRNMIKRFRRYRVRTTARAALESSRASKRKLSSASSSSSSPTDRHQRYI